MNPTIKALSLFLFCAVAVFAQTDNPLCAISNSPTIGQVITATSTGAPATCSWQAGGGGGGSVAVQANGVAVGSQPILNFIPGPGITNTLSDTGTKINIQQGVDTAVIPTIAAWQAGLALSCNPASASGTAYTCGLPTALTAYTTGQMLVLKPDVNGTGGATTLNIDSLGARPVKEWDGTTNPTSSDLVAGRPYWIWNDGTNWRLPYVPAGSSSTPGTSGQFLTTDGSGGFGTSVSGVGTGSVVRAISPPLTGTPTAPTPAATDNSTTLATTAYVTTGIANAINAAAGRDLVTAASAAVLPNTPTYSNGASGIGATLTSGSNVALVVDGYTCVINDRILVKNQASALQNGIYYCSQVGTGILPWILTRAIDYDTTSDINNTIVPVANHGTVNALTSWIQTATVATVGTDSITFAAFTPSGANIVTAVSPGAGIAHFAGGTQAATSSPVVLTSEVSGVLPQANGGQATVMSTAGTGYYLPWGDPYSGGQAIGCTGSPNCVIYFEFQVPATMVFNKLSIYETALDAGKHYAWGLYNSSSVLIQQTNTVVDSGNQPTALTFAASVTCTPGVYFLAFTSDSTTLRFNGGSDGYLAGILTAALSSKFRTFFGSTPSGGTSTLTLPPTFASDTRTTTGGNLPTAVLYP